MKLSGSIVALVTPFNDQDLIDWDALKDLIDWHKHVGTQGFLIAGSTGEGLLLSIKEYSALLTFVRKHWSGPLLAGICAIKISDAVALAEQAQNCAVDYLSVVCPPYIKPAQMGLEHYFTAIHNATQLPIIVYNNPGRCIVDLSIETIKNLSELPRIVGLKDSHHETSRLLKIRQAIQKPFSLFSGDDTYSPGHLSYGADGLITSGIGNIAPALSIELIKSVQQKNWLEVCSRYMALEQQLFVESNPIAVKYTLFLMNKIQPFLRAPLTILNEKYHNPLKQALLKAGVLS